MNYLKYTPFLYLIVAIAFLYDAFSKWNLPEATPILSLAFLCFSLEEILPTKCRTEITNPRLWKLAL